MLHEIIPTKYQQEKKMRLTNKERETYALLLEYARIAKQSTIKLGYKKPTYNDKGGRKGEDINRISEALFNEIDRALSRLKKDMPVAHQVLLESIYGNLSNTELAEKLGYNRNKVSQLLQVGVVWVSSALKTIEMGSDYLQ